MGGKIIYKDDTLFFIPKDKMENKEMFPISLCSSLVRSLIDLDLFINHVAQKGIFLMIDEPEMNLHPDNQIKLARVLAFLANEGIDIFVTTHSDYFVREINNLIMLSNEFKAKKTLIRKYGYSAKEALKKEDVKVYYYDEKVKEIRNVHINEKGIENSVFNEIIAHQEDSCNEIYFSLEE